jgi:hypothetical protein
LEVWAGAGSQEEGGQLEHKESADRPESNKQDKEQDKEQVKRLVTDRVQTEVMQEPHKSMFSKLKVTGS